MGLEGFVVYSFLGVGDGGEIIFLYIGFLVLE
jgi:hypothetical protein